MRRTAFLAIAATLAACGSGGGDAPPPARPRIASPLPAGAPPGLTSFAQSVRAEDGLGELFPGQANTWVLERDFSLAKGYGGQVQAALALFLGTPTTPTTHASLGIDLPALAPFPSDQDVSEVTWLTPLFGAADGVLTAAVFDGTAIGVPPLAGTRSGYLDGTSASRLSRAVTLATGPSWSLSWKDQAFLVDGRLLGASAPPHAASYRVVLRDSASGELLQELFATSADVAAPHDAAFASTISGTVAISFELRSAAGGLAVVDDVVLAKDGMAVGTFVDGDFEGAGLGPWSASAGAESQNVRSGARPVPAGADPSPVLSVTRTFYAPPAASWARTVDVFDNESATTVSTHAVYVTVLGGTSPRAAVRASGRAIVGWDADGLARDVAIVHGTGTAFVDGTSGVAYVVHPLEVPPGGKVALAHFVVQLGRTEGGPTAANVPPGTDAAASEIAGGFPGQAAYAQDLEAGVRERVRNF